MPETFQWLNAFPPKGGLDLATNPLLGTLDQLTQADDIIFTTDLRRAQRPGEKLVSVTNGTVNTDFPHVRYVYDFWYRSGTAMTNRIIKINADRVNADSQGDGKFNEITGTTALGMEDAFSLETFANNLVLCSETAVPQVYSGTGTLTDLSGTPPNGRLCRKHLSRLWIAGVKAAPHRIYYGQAFSITGWSGVGTGFLEVDPDDNDPVGITAIFPSFFGELYVAKRNALYQITGTTPSTFQVIPLISGLGCQEHNSVAKVNNDILFASDRGIHSLVAAKQGSGLSTEFISFPVQPLWDSEINATATRRFCGVFLRGLNSYILLYPANAAGYATHALGYNAVLGAWFRWPNTQLSALTETYSGSRMRTLCGRNDGKVSELDLGAKTSLGGGIYPSIKTGPVFPTGTLAQDLGFKFVNVVFSSPQRAALELSYKVANFPAKTKTLAPSDTGAKLGPGYVLGITPLGGGPGTVSKTVPLEGNGISIAVQQRKKLSGTPLGSGFVLGSVPLANTSTTMDFLGLGIQVGLESTNRQETGAA